MISVLSISILSLCITAGICMLGESRWERIETTLETIYGNQGVPVKFCYNETSVSEGVTSVPGCPKSINGIPWIYYGNPPRCFLAGHHGPCPIGQKLLAVHGTPFGICACECFVDDIQLGLINWKPSHLTSNNHKTMPVPQRYFYCLRNKNDGGELGQIFDTETKTCFPIYSEGPCERGKVITGLDFETKFPICKEATKEMQVDVNPFSNNGCGLANITPVTSIASIQANRCRDGERYSEELRKCVKDQRFVVPYTLFLNLKNNHVTKIIYLKCGHEKN